MQKVFIENTGFLDEETSLLSIVDIRVVRHADITKSPVELGYSIMDYKVIMPIEVVVKCMIKDNAYESVMSRIRQMFANRTATRYFIKTKTEIIPGLILHNVSESQTADKFDAYIIELRFTELITANVVTVPREKQNMKPKDSGVKVPSEPTRKPKFPLFFA